MGPVELGDQIRAQLGTSISRHLEADLGPDHVVPIGAVTFPLDSTCRLRDDEAAWGAFVSVVICTMSRPRQLRNALDALLALSYPNFEIIVVDNAPDDVTTANLIRERYADCPNLRYEAEPVRGLSSARNRGIDAAKGEILAFTDDDIIVDRYWLSSLVSGFDKEGAVACVTGLSLASELESPAQAIFEHYGAFNQGYESRLFTKSANPASVVATRHSGRSDLYPYAAAVFGGGGNCAVRVDGIPGGLRFDRRLGPGSLSFGAEDLDIFLQIILSGKAIRYVPAALAWHEHRRSYQDLRWQLFTYGAGFTAYLTKWATGDFGITLDMVRVAPRLLTARFRASAEPDSSDERMPRDLLLLEWLGFAYGPIAYLRSVLHLRRSSAGQHS